MSPSPSRIKMRQVVDWRAVVWAGILSGVIFLIINMLLTKYYVGSPWMSMRLAASILLGEKVLQPSANFELRILGAALLVHLPLSLAFASIVAIILHRWGLLVGIVGGALFGLALYVINFYTFSFFFPWFFPLRSWIMAVSHLVFGACAGGIYEGLEVEKFVPAEA